MTKSFKEETVRQLAEILNDTNLTEIEYEVDNCRIRVAREVRINQVVSSAAPHSAVAPAAPVGTPPLAETLSSPASEGTAIPATAVKSPMVGTAYLAPNPGADPFVKVGDQVAPGQTLLIIEAMKVMNQIKATAGGQVKDILVRDGDPIEYDQPLIIVE